MKKRADIYVRSFFYLCGKYSILIMREDTYTFKKFAQYTKSDMIGCCWIPVFIIGLGIFSIFGVADSLHDCDYSQGVFESQNSNYNGIILHKSHDSFDPNIPCKRFSSEYYFKFNDNIYNKIDSIVSVDTAEHFIQIWFQEHKHVSTKGIIGKVQYWDEYYQIIVDGYIVLPFDKLEHINKEMPGMIIGVLLFVVIIIIVRRTHRNSYFIKKYTKKYFDNKDGLTTIASDLSEANLPTYTEFRLYTKEKENYIVEEKYRYLIKSTCLWQNKYQDVLLDSFCSVGCFKDLVWFHREQRNRNKNVCSLEKCPNPYKYYPNCNIYSGNDYPKDTDTNCMYHIEDDWYIRLP